MYFSYFITIYESKYIDVLTKVTYRNQKNSDNNILNLYQFNILSLNYKGAIMGHEHALRKDDSEVRTLMEERDLVKVRTF